MKTELRVIALLLLATGCSDDAVVPSDVNASSDTNERDVASEDITEDTGAGDDATATDGDDATVTDSGEDASAPDVPDEDVSGDVVTLPNAELRALHLASGAGAVDLHLNGVGPVVSGLAFTGGTAFQPVVGGTLEVDVVPTGQPLQSSVLNGDVTVAEGSATSVAVLSSADGLSLLSYESDRAPPASGRVRVRFIHAAAMGPVDVWEGDSIVADDLDFRTVVAGAELPAGPRRYALDTTLDGVADQTCNLGSFPAGTIADVFLTGDQDAPALIVWFDNGATVEVACTTIPLPQDDASLRVLHAASGAGPVDVTLASLSDAPTWEGLDYPAGTSYLTIPATLTDLTVTGAGASEPLLVGAIDLDPGAVGSLIVVSGSDDALSSVATLDDRSPPPDGTVRLRVVHAVSGLPAVKATLADVTLASELSFGAAADAVTVGSELLADEQAPLIVLTWVAGGATEQRCALPGLPAGSIATVVVSRSQDDGGVELLLWNDDGSPVVTVACDEPPPPPEAELRVLHLVPSLAPVSASVGDTTLTDSLAFPGGTPYATVLAGDATLTLTALDGGATVATTVSLLEGSASSAIALQTEAGVDVVLLADDRSPPSPGRARVRAFHAAAGVPAVDLYAGGSAIVTGLAFGAASAALEVDAAAIELGIDTTADGKPELLCALPALAAGDVVTAFAAPADGGVQIVLWFDDGATVTAPCSPPPPEGASLRALHLLSGVAPLNVTRGGLSVATTLPSYTGSTFTLVPVTAETVVFTSTTSGATLATVASQTLVNGASYTAVALGPSASPSAVLLTDDLSPVPAGQVRGRFVHAIAGTGVIDVYATPTPTTKVKVSAGLTLGKAGVWLQGANSPVATGVDVGADGKLEWSCPKVPVANGSVTSIYYVLQGGVLKMVHVGDTGAVVVTACAAAL